MVLIGCGLSLEGVAGVDRVERLPAERDAKDGFIETTEFQMKVPGHPWISNGQEDPVVMSLGFPCRGTTLMPGLRINILHTVQHRKKISNTSTCVISCGASQWLESDLKRYIAPRETAVWE